MSTSRRTPSLPPIGYYVRITVAVLLTLLLAVLVYQARSVLVLIFLGVFIAVGLDPVVSRLERHGVRRGISVTVLALLVAGAVVAVVLVVVVPAVGQVTTLIESVPNLITKFNHVTRNTAIGDYLNRPDVQSKIQSAVGSALLNSAGSLGSIFGIIGGVAAAVFAGVTLFVLVIYFSLALPRLRRGAAALLGAPQRQEILDEALSKVGAYVTGQLAICVCAGTASYVALLLIGVPYPAILAIVIAVLDAVPQVGATIGAVIAVVIALTVSLPVALLTLVYFVVYQQVENYLIAPRIFSRTIAMTPLASLLSVLIGAALAGVVGAIVALPITAAALVVFRHTPLGRRLEARRTDPAEAEADPETEPVADENAVADENTVADDNASSPA